SKEKEMNRRTLHVAGVAFAAAFALAGCVSKGDYEKLEADKNKEIDGLQKERGGLQDQVKNLQSDRTTLTQQKALLEGQVSALEQQKTQLLTATQQDKSQYDALVR